MKKFFPLLVLLPLVASAQPLQEQVQTRLHIPALEGAIWGGLAAYADEPQTELFNLQADTRLTPASTLKLLTTAAALEQLGPDFRFETNLFAATPQDGVVQGPLYIQGGADPTLGAARVLGAEPYEEVLKKWVKAIQKAGITKIDGNLLADVSLFEGPSIGSKVNWGNIGNYFAAPASPLCFNDNSFEIHFRPQPQAGQLTEVEYIFPQVDNITLENFVTTDGKTNKDNAYVYGAPEQYNLKIFGTIPTNKKGFRIKASLPDPALFAAQALKQELEKNGITVTGVARTTTDKPDYTQLQHIHTYKSPKLAEIVLIVNKRSFNLYADMLLRALAVHNGQKGSMENGLKALNEFLIKNKIATEKEAVIYDGSGLSRDTIISPRVLVNTLNFMAKSPYFEDYYKSLATPDDRGDLLVLRRFLKPQKKVNEVRIKGGTIDNVKALAGYVYDKNGRLISFAFMANNLAGKDESLLRAHEDIIKDLLNVN